MPTIVEVAKRAQVSIATVSNVIRGTRKVSPERRERVEAAVRELNYHPNQIARSLKVKQTRMLAMVLPDITNPFFPEIIRGAEDAAFQRGYFLVTANTDEQVEREGRIIGALRTYRVDGILLATARSWVGNGVDPIRDLVQSGLPIVCLDRTVPNLATDAVLLDNVGGARECVKHLIEQGHWRIAIVTGKTKLQTAHERLLGYRLAMEEAGLEVDEELVVSGDSRIEPGREQAHALLAKKPRPSAIFVCNGLMAQGVLQAFEEAKIECPRDIALATFDEIPSDHGSHAHTTAVVQPGYEMGSRAATMLMDRIEGRAEKDTSVIRVAPKLMLRESTRRVLQPR